MAIAVLGILVTLLVSAFLSRTWLKGEASTFSLELPPYRPPRILKTLYTSVLDRTLIVLWRAVTMAAPAGGSDLVDEQYHDRQCHDCRVHGQFAQSAGGLIELNGIILVAYIVAIPANEIIIPTILMLTLTLGRSQTAQAGVMLELDDAQVYTVLTQLGGWTLLKAVNLMLFSLLHNPCSTTILTIWNETKNLKWTVVSTLLPLALAFAVTLFTAAIVRLFA